MKLVIATTNKNKFFEIKDKFKLIKDLDLVSLESFTDYPDVLEDGETFLDNAVKKAKELSTFTDMPVLADDSGLAVDCLGGRPGVFSARYGGDGLTDIDRYNLLLNEMKSVSPENRGAKFVCVIAIAIPNRKILTTTGECKGIIASEPLGDKGFGYDPVFYLPEYKKTMAQISMDEKNKISHRARALEKSQIILERFLKDYNG